MDSSRRAVEAYWRSRMIDGVTSDEDKVAPVYKLEEVCGLLRSSHVSIVKEVSDYILKRLDHKSPVVKQKALRLIKYSVGKSGTEFRREMQRHSAVMRQLFHYKGHPDPLKGDALNKSVRETAHEAVSAIFANNDNAAMAPTEDFQKRIQGFGNTNYEMPTEEKKSFLSEVVGVGLSTIAAANSMRKNDSGIGCYKSPNLQRSLTAEIGGRDRYEGGNYLSGNFSSSGPRNEASRKYGQDLRTVASTTANEDVAPSHTGIKSCEERLLETIVTSGGVRLQPTRDAIQVFLLEALKLDPLPLSHALEVKLQSPLWQVRMKACCVLESILRKKDDEHFSIVASYFGENRDPLVKCSEIPQVSLREKASKVLSLLDGDWVPGTGNQSEPSSATSVPTPVVQMPDLIDTGDADDYRTEASIEEHVPQNIENLISSGSLVDYLFADGPIAGQSNSENENEDNPFADVSFHVTEEKQNDDIFLGLIVDNKTPEHEKQVGKECGLLDTSSSNYDLLQETETNKSNMNDLMVGLSLNDTIHGNKQPEYSGVPFMGGINQSSQVPTNGALNGTLGSNSFFPASTQYMQPNMMFNPAFANQPMNYDAMGAFIAHQQLLFQNLGNLNTRYRHATENVIDGGHSSPLPDIFQPSNIPVQSNAAALTNRKKEDTKAFDFVLDHLSAARDSKRVL
ncbi:uncharacterized protein A4U43_C06F17130 [Asparagus officinalis]|uniref:VHS domain-containing protein n=1 Tax=Asparagus officinalis TaxID=4686 RepID=A0A5P1ENF0_ASPOF|nr:VHS domain-containing protein At3g16270-like [Asparagus officinalis]ONK67183.1 uncharacterized protein A4U43_C06F17130 [Asparagus officinalis]